MSDKFNKNKDEELTGEELLQVVLDLKHGAVKEILDAVIKEKPEFKNLSLMNLKDNKDFLQVFKKYIAQELSLKESEMPEEIQALDSILPDNFYITNNKLSNEIIKNFVQKGNISLRVINPNKKGEIITYNSLTYEGKNISITGRYEFTAYDRTIHNAVCSLYEAGNDTVTPAMVYRAVNGMMETEKVSPQSVEAVRNSLDKSRFMRLKVDFTEEAKARNMKIDKAEIDSNLLNATVVTVESGGHKVEAYKILAKPVLYEYAQRTRQIISVPPKLLDTKEATRSTEEIIPIKEYLIRRIEIMRHDKTMSNKIVYDTIFEEVGITITTKQQKSRLRDYIKSILELWKTRDGYFYDFKEYSVGKSVKGIEIMLYEKR